MPEIRHYEEDWMSALPDLARLVPVAGKAGGESLTQEYQDASIERRVDFATFLKELAIAEREVAVSDFGITL